MTFPNTFYRNQGGAFRDVTDELRLGMVSRAFTGFGTGLLDYDNDGRFDIFIANGKVGANDDAEFDYAEPNQLLRGLADGSFVDVSSRAGSAVTRREVSRAAAFGDFDNDGDIDILVANNGGPARLLRNESGNDNHWLSIQLSGRPRQLDRDALGAIVTITTNGRTRRRLVQSAYSYAASNDPRVHFGLGEVERVERVSVQWPGGGCRPYLSARSGYSVSREEHQDGIRICRSRDHSRGVLVVVLAAYSRHQPGTGMVLYRAGISVGGGACGRFGPKSART